VKCDNIDELFVDDDCFGFANAKECNDYFNNPSPSDNNEDDPNLFEEKKDDSYISNISTMTIPLTPTLQLNVTISDILRLLLTQEVSGTDRLLLISELEQLLQSLVTDHTINVELDTENDERTITTTITLTELVEEQPGEEKEEDSGNDNGDDNDNGNEDPEPEPEPDPNPPPEDPELPEEPPEDLPLPPFG
jgi:hypothetical protein